MSQATLGFALIGAGQALYEARERASPFSQT